MPRSWMKIRRTGTLAIAFAAPAFGQAPPVGRVELTAHRVAGAVQDTAGAPIAFADILLTAGNGWHHALISDGTGHFAFASVPMGPAQIQVRRLGFRPITSPLLVSSTAGSALDSTRIILDAIAVELANIEVSDDALERDGALAGFNARRRSNNFGTYLDRAEIEATHAQRASDALRRVPGLLIQPSTRIGNIVRVRNCRPTVWIDGIRIPNAELDEVTSVDDVAAVEIYKSLAGLPQQFIDRTNPCGGILIWSRSH
jgi:hypothetical protein